MKNAQKIIDNYTSGSLDLSGCDLKGITLPTSVGGWLDLSGCDLKGITLPTSVGGSLYLSGCDLKGITLPTSVGGSLDLSGCDLKGITLPTSVGGSLYLSGCENVPNGVYNCGEESRVICVYNHPENGLVVSLGCFIGTETECHEAIENKYGQTSAGEKYKLKITEAFQLYYQANNY